jgi:hypothetical protein
MDQSEADVHMVLPGGFIWRDGRMLNTDQCEVTLPGLQFKHAGSSAFFSEVDTTSFSRTGFKVLPDHPELNRE